jgi:hypothetical protein
MISDRTARFLRLKAGDTVLYQLSERLDGFTPVRVTGVYRPLDLADPYWASGGVDLLATGVHSDAPPGVNEPVDDALLTTPDGLAGLKPTKISVAVDSMVNGRVFVEISPQDLIARLSQAERALDDDNRALNTELTALASRVDRDQRLIYLGVPAGASQLLLLCWLALYLGIKYTGQQRRPDIGLLKLRGTTRSRAWTVVAGQSAVPMLIGAVLGVPIGFLAARLLAGPITAPDVAARARDGAVLAAGLAVLGALAAALLAERRALGATVTELLRQVPGRRPAWRDVTDLAVVVLAAVAVYQVRSHATGDSAGLALLAPGLAALAFALVAARVVTLLAGRAVPGALRAGRAGVALTAISLARRPGVHRLCALLIVTVALSGTAGLAWAAGTHAAAVRADLDVGADRVLTVRADNRSALLSSVRAADPSGRYAMAAVELGTGSNQPVLLVDSTRLAAVARWHPWYGWPTAAQAAAALHPPGYEPITVTGTELAIEASAGRRVPRNGQLLVAAVLADAQGHRVEVRFGPLTATAQQFRTPVAGCAEAPHCRLVALSVVESVDGGASFFTARDGAFVTVTRLDQRGPDRPIVEPGGFADRSRWRVTATNAPPNLIATSAQGGGLALAVAGELQSGGSVRDPGVYPMDAPVPLPAVRLGNGPPGLTGDPRVAVGAASLPVRSIAAPTWLPRLGSRGVLMDLEYADRVGDDFGGGDVLEVWLTADAPASVLTALRGLTVLGDQTVHGVTDRYTHLGPPLALRFALGSALIGLLLAAGSFSVVAAVERPSRRAELDALRAQGAPARLTKRVAIGSHAVLIGVALVAGTAAALLLRLTIGDVVPFFADGWMAP